MILARSGRLCDDGRMRCERRSGTGRGRCRWARCPTPPAPRTACSLRVTACGICGTDVRTFYNGDRRISPPWVLGHEISGELIEIGARARRPRSPRWASRDGDLVHCISTLWCGRCRLCRSGQRAPVRQRRPDGLRLPGRLRRAGRDPPGRAQEPVPDPRRPLRRARDVRRPAVGRDLRPQGHRDRPRRHRRGRRRRARSARRTAAIARLEGAGHVLLLETAADRLDLAREILGDERMAYVDTSGADGIAAVRAATEDIGADVVIVACSSDIAQEQAMEMAAPRGRVLFFGGLPKGTTHISFPSNVLHYREVQVHGSYASRHRDQVHALDMLAGDIGGLRGVVSDVVDLDGRPGGVRAHPRRRGAQGRRHALGRAAVTTPRPPLAAPLDRRRAARTGGGGRVRRPATACPASRSWPAAWASRAARCGRRSRCSRRTGSCGGCTGRAPTSPTGRCCATTSAATSASPR